MRQGLGVKKQQMGAAFGIALVAFVLAFQFAAIHNNPGSHAMTELTSAAVPVCGERAATDVEQYTGPALPKYGQDGNGDALADTQLIANTNGFVRYWAKSGQDSRWYALNGINNTTHVASFSVYDATTNAATPIGTFTITIPAGQTGERIKRTFAVDPGGDVYVGTYNVSGGDVVSRWSWTAGTNTAATEVWHATTTGLIQGGIYGYIDANNVFRLGVVVQSGSTTEAFSNTFNGATGASMGNNNVIGGVINVATAHNNDIVSADTNNGQYVRIYDATGMTQTFYMGTDLGANSAGPWHFYILASANEDASGHIVVADSGHGLEFFDPTGVYLGMVGDDPGNSANAGLIAITPSITANSNLQVVNGNFDYQTGGVFSTPQNLIQVTGADAQAIYRAPQVTPFHFGIGAGLFTSATNNYFANGTTPVVNLEFYPWWASQASNYSVSYTVRTIQQVTANQAVTPTTFTLASKLSGTPTAPVNVSVPLPAANPDLYEVDAKLIKNGTVVGADCTRYTVGAVGDTLNFAALPSGTNQGQVEVAHQMGQKLLRGSFGIDDCLASYASTWTGGSPTNQVPTASTPLACPAAEVSDIQAAATLAVQDGMQFELQVFSNTSNMDRAIVNGQTSSAHDIMMSLSAQVATLLSNVKYFEAWNEMNNTYCNNQSSPQANVDYCVNNIIHPFYTAVKGAVSSDTVVGGSILGPSTWFWQDVANDGGFAYMDAIGDHPYTGHNRSWEEEGQVGQMQSIQAILAAAGHPNMPIWDTESGFWNNGTNQYYTQGDKLIRKLILEASIGITDVSNYYDTQTGSDGSGYNWGLIDPGGLDPGGLASVTYEHMLGSYVFNSTVSTSIPHTYAYDFKPASGTGAHIDVLWSDDFNVDATLALSGGGSMTVTDEYGGQTTLANNGVMHLNGSVQYVSVPSGQTLGVKPVEAYGTNYASAAQSAVATDDTTSGGTSNDSCGTPASAIDTVYDAEGIGDMCNGMSVWSTQPTDANPYLDVKLHTAQTIDRVYVAGQDSGSVETALRGFDVQVSTNNGSTYTTVATVANQFYQRDMLVNFTARTGVTNIRIANIAIDYSGYGDGLKPIFWDSSFLSSEVATVYTLEAYGPGAQAVSSAPTVSITSPAAGSSEHSTVAVTASATDHSGSGIQKVEFYGNGALLATDTSAPYGYSLNTLPLSNGAYSITAKAYDNNSNATISNPVVIVVNNGDINGDNSDNLADLRVLAQHYPTSSGATYSQGDLTGDGAVGLADLRILANHYGWTYP